MSDPIRRLTTSQSPVFLVNSRLGLVTATPVGSGREDLHLPGAPLLPKLRGYFAEFLNESSLAHLRILSPSTCVGLRYGHPYSSLARVFLAVRLRPVCGPKGLPFASRRWVDRRICLPVPPTRLDRDIQHPDGLHPCVTPQAQTLIWVVRDYLTRFPSTTPLGLALGPD